MTKIKFFSLFVFSILYQIAGFLGILWCLSLLACFFAPITVIPTYVYPLALYGFMFFFLINPTKTFYYKSRFWLLKLLVSPNICVSFLERYTVFVIGFLQDETQAVLLHSFRSTVHIVICMSGSPALESKNAI